MPGQLADRFLVPGERVELPGQTPQQRVAPARLGERDPDGSDRLAVAPVDDRALVAAERPDAVAGAQEREVGADHGVQQAAQVGLDPALHRRFLLVRVGEVERPAADPDPGPVPQVDVPQRAPVQPDPPQRVLAQPGQGQEGLVLVVGRGVIGADRQQQKRFHQNTLAADAGPNTSLQHPARYGAGMAKRPRVTVLGSLNMDISVTVPRLPGPGMTVLGSAARFSPGGKGANQAVAAARLGAEVRMVGCVGDDDFGRQLLADLRAEGVDTDAVRTVPGAPTGLAMIAVDEAGENLIIVAPGANHQVGPPEVARAAVHPHRHPGHQRRDPRPRDHCRPRPGRVHCIFNLAPAPETPARPPDRRGGRTSTGWW